MKYIFLFISFFYLKSYSQNYEEALMSLRNFEPKKTLNILKNLDSSFGKKLIEIEVIYLIEGYQDSLLFFNKPKTINNVKEKILYNLYFGDYLRRNSKTTGSLDQDQTFKFKLKAHNLYFEALNLAQGLDEIYEKEALWRILDYYTKNSTKNEPNLKNFKKYLDRFSTRNNSVYDFWYHYFKLTYKIISIDEGKERSTIDKSEFIKLKSLADQNNYLKGRALQLEALCYDLYFKDIETSYKTNLLALEQYLKTPYYFSLYRSETVQLNIAVDLKNLKNFKDSKKKLLSILSDSIFEKTEKLHKSDIYNWLSEIYVEEGKSDSALYFKNLYIENEEDIKRHANAIAMHVISEEFQFEKLKQNIIKYRWYYISALIIVFMIALYSFLRWKKADRKEKQVRLKLNDLIETEKQARNRVIVIETQKRKKDEELELLKEEIEKQARDKIIVIETQKRKKDKELELLKEEIEQTLQEIERLKKITVLEHIVLINGVRLPLSELMYIKADGHFLHFFTEKSREFVSGTLKSILNDLPPNFIQTHKSYVVNFNFIHYSDSMRLRLKDNTEIRIGRIYKEKVKKMIELSNALK
ncbi:hypothetical protein IMCC3317_40630 [Kordia antarctica]|uniref:HTH LytTR-type domain-containing protein n=1 Tax=Kordia antarctica TaxID=1218801 RepID=A0A7L4ZQC8_9FLAO|nr:LytTR family transcriptional regulator DNA-binding domain-containing protein [Kordia antarctica]QHI38669.1 hypothetical protein IMCC3317_40630 [Kordia antarctica]